MEQADCAILVELGRTDDFVLDYLYRIEA
jgi:hypothetical protein